MAYEEISKCYNYTIKPDWDREAYETEHYSIILSTGKTAIMLKTDFFNGGSFSIMLSDEEAVDIAKMDKIDLANYDSEFEELYDVSSRQIELMNEELYNDDEFHEIMTLSCEYPGESFDENDCRTIFMEDNGWCQYDTDYGFHNGCILIKN